MTPRHHPPTATWPPEHRRPCVLIEVEDGAQQWAMEHILREAGYDVAACGGPATLDRRRCPLAAGGDCALAEGADVVVNGLPLHAVANRAVLAALRRECPDTPVIVEAAEPQRRRHAAALAGTEVLPFPMTSATLTAAVASALGDP